MFSNLTKITALVLFCSSSCFGQTDTAVRKVPNTPVQQLAQEILGYTSMKHASFSFFVKNMGTGGSVADINSEMSIPSASTMKLVTTATAFQILGAGYRFQTRIMYSGSLDSVSGTLNGDLYIVGGGDPTLGSRHYNSEGHQTDFLKTWADSLKSLGINKVNGRVIADGSLYRYDGVPSGWVWGDIGNYYGAGPAGLTIFDNMCILHFNTKFGGDTTELMCTEPFIPGLNIINEVKSDNSGKDNAYVYGAPYSTDWFAMGSIPRDKENFQVKASIPDPELVAALEFEKALSEAGISTSFAPATMREVSKKYPQFVKPELTELLVHRSPTLSSIINIINHESINLFAEHVLCQISVRRSGYGSTTNGAAICTEYWSNKIDGTGLFMTDGSGLSRSNAVSAKFLVDMLVSMHSSGSAESLKASMALAGKRGTMSGLCRGTAAEGRVYGKSGTMTRMKSYAGYVDTTTGKKLAYSMIVNNYTCSTAQLTKWLEALMVKMAQY